MNKTFLDTIKLLGDNTEKNIDIEGKLKAITLRRAAKKNK